MSYGSCVEEVSLLCGIEYEYLLSVQESGGRRLLDHTTLEFAQLQEWLARKPGCCDLSLATGDLGVKSGYWYLEGDERFDEQGHFTTLAVKGIEIRTPPRPSVEAALGSLLAIEQALASVLASRQMQLAIAGFNPYLAKYEHQPPLNGWERQLRSEHQAYDAAHVSTLSFGPDINLSFAHFSQAQALAATQRLISWAPYIVPFSFSSPCYSGRRWEGWSKRTFERHTLRPTAKLFWSQAQAQTQAKVQDQAQPDAVTETSESRHPLIYPPRLPSEQGRIEFKAFDAIPSQELLQACCYLLIGLCLADEMPEPAELDASELFQLAARQGFDEPQIYAGAQRALISARSALLQRGMGAGVLALAPLAQLLQARSTPAERLLAHYAQSGFLYLPGGLQAYPTLGRHEPRLTPSLPRYLGESEDAECRFTLC